MALLILLIPFLFQQGNLLYTKSRRNASSSPILFTSSTLYGPYEAGDEATFTWSYTNVSGINYSSVNDYIILDCPSYSSVPFHTKRVGKHALPAGSSQTCSFTYKISSARFNTESGIIIRVGVHYANSYLSLLEKRIRPIDSRTINPLNYRSSPYVIRERSFYFKDIDVEESFLFDEYRDYVECDEYNRLLFGNLSFKYSYPTSLSYQSASIKFMDPENLFPSIRKDGDGYRYLSINLVEKEGRVVVDFPSLYYNPVTLVTNDQGIGNKTRYLYVPKGKSKKLKEYEFIIEARGLGINKTSFSHCLETSISPFYLGDCLDADYCVIGGIKE
ncbi:MAG: hypothetical protein J5618_01565 [Bacilli bacterium]|nr:hypothetical protein [Bacilli bacterium]